MILTRTPFRIPLGGGGTDLPSFYQKHGGFLFSATINKYMYVAVNYSPVEKVIRVTHSDAEIANTLEEVKHDLAREAMRKMQVPVEGLEVASFADLPPGTGMGSSGSYIVGVLKAFGQQQGKEFSKQELAELACHIELDILEKPIGKQDQYCASFGGFIEMDIAKDGTVKARRPDFSPEVLQELKENTLLVYTFKKHDTVDILSEQSSKAAVSGSDVEKAMLKIKDIGRQLMSEMEGGSVKNFGKLMDEHWRVKKTISTKMSDPWLDEVYELALKNGADGGKIMGSGGGGLFMFFAPGKKHELLKVLTGKGLAELPFEFDFEGSKVILNSK